MQNTNRLCVSCMKEIEEFDICPYCGYSQSTPYLPEYLPPRTILQERYSLGKVIKKNGEAVSYISYDIISEHTVVINEFFPNNICCREKSDLKVYPYTGNESRYKALMLDFIDLARILTRSRSLSAIIPVIDVFEENNTVYTVSQYVETISLREYLIKQGGVITWEKAKNQFAPIISAVNTIQNSVNLNHYGISPETILVDKNEQFKLSGFSIEALRLAKSDIVSELYAGYAAPEQYNSANWLGPWTDVYAIAAVIYKSITGTMPPESTSRIVNDNLLPAYKLDKAIPVNISNALYKAMNVSPEKRTQSVEELILAFSETNDFLNSEDDEDDSKPVNSKMNWIWAGIIAASIIIVALLGYFVYNAIFAEEKEHVFDQSGSSEMSDEEILSNDDSMKNNGEFAVGNYVGKKLVDINEPNFKIKEEFIFDNKIEKGVVIKQSIEKGKKVSRNTEIVLTTSKGPESIKMPDLIGSTRKFAETKLNDLGIKFEIVEEATNHYQAGTVINTNPSKDFTINMDDNNPVLIVIAVAPTVVSKEPAVSKEPSDSSKEPAVSKEPSEPSKEPVVSKEPSEPSKEPSVSKDISQSTSKS